MNKSRTYVSIIFCALIIATCLTANAQVTPLEKKTDALAQKAIQYLNNNLPDSVYALGGERFHKQLTPALWASVYKNQFSQLLPFKSMVFISSKDSINKYKLQGSVSLAFYVSLDKQGKLDNFLFQPFQEEIKPSVMNELEKRTDSVFKKVLTLINHKQADSVYIYAGDYFKSKINAKTWKSVAETGLFPLVPLPEPVFVSSKNGVNKYRLNQYQFVFGLDKENKYNVLALQPYQEDKLKSTMVLSDNPLKSHLDSVVNQVLSAYIKTKENVGVSAGIYINEQSYFYNYGETKRGSKQLPTNHTLYDIGSITKTFTTTLLAIAVGQGKTTLSTPISTLLPDSVANNPALKGITLEELANHTSGLPRLPSNASVNLTDSNQPYANYGLQQMFSYLKHMKSVRQPGTAYEYSNFGVGLLGVLLERILHKPYQELVNQYIIKPVGLHETYFILTPTNAALLAQGYDEQSLAVPSWDFLAMQPAGALKSSASDLITYGRLQLSTKNTALARAVKLTHRITYDNGSNTVGLGWQYSSDNHHVLQHSGGTGGYRSLICIDTDKKIVVAVLTNNATTGDAAGVQLMHVLQTISK